ncbi:heme biosynthesis HemY N-terminal domain-containing protein [Vibrio rumoiensis]|uniref:Heme biosynthesis protein HemY n=1 Tax=Vibrio rumoiensis 1S-45 TaxID=1188252 RepID=A0A1E5E1T5_9VIBR|nr:heme biosynthesis HemY N-terminal domain-containing protein [Vibrio rumoiensis]OEF24352.1 heme biosynthesis protein HemY [Vibrio rumoiensis 1S-45]
MFRIIFIFVTLGLGLFVGTQFSDQQGYVLISVADTTTEMSVTTLVIFIVAALAALFLLENIIKRGFRATNATWNWFSVRKLKRARRYTNEGIIKLLEGDWNAAEKKVTRWANHHDMPLLCYLIASEAAQGMGDDKKREKYINLALEHDKNSLAIEMTQIRQMVRNKQFADAHSSLEKLKGRYPNNTIVMNLLKKTYLNLKLWSLLDELLPKLKRANVISDTEFDQLFYQAQLGKMEEVGEQKGINGLLSYWSHLPKKLKQDENIVELLIKQLLVQNGDSEAYVILRDILKQSPSERLLPLITQIQLPDIHPATLLLEGIVKKHKESAEAHSALGELYSRELRWKDAQQSFEVALQQRISISDYSRLADALEQQGMKQAAGEVSRKALTLLEK